MMDYPQYSAALDNVTTDVDDADLIVDYYNIYYSGDIDNLNSVWVRQPHFVPLITLYGTVFLCGIPGNCIVVFAILGSRSARNVTFSFMLSLAVADLLFLLVCIPYDVWGMLDSHWAGGRVFCKLSGYVEMLSAVASILHLTTISVERYFVILRPLQSRKWCTVGNTRRILFIVWLTSAVLSIPPAVMHDVVVTTFYNNDTAVKISLCGENTDDDILLYFAIYQLVIMFVLPTVVMGYSYSVVIHALWRSQTQLLSLTKSQSSLNEIPRGSNGITGLKRSIWSAANEMRSSALKARQQVVKMLVTIVIMFLLCWGPKLILQILKRLQLEFMFYPSAFHAQIGVYCLTYVQSCVNPVVYGLMCKNFRVSLRHACRRTPCYSLRHACRRTPCYSLCRGHRLTYTSDIELQTGLRLNSETSRLQGVATHKMGNSSSHAVLIYSKSAKSTSNS